MTGHFLKTTARFEEANYYFFEENIDDFRLQIDTQKRGKEGTSKCVKMRSKLHQKTTPNCTKNAVKIVSEMYAKWCRNCVQKQCANCVAKTAFFCVKKRCCKVMQMNTLRVFPLARVNKQTNEQTNKTPYGVMEKMYRKEDAEEEEKTKVKSERARVTDVPVFG